VAPEVHRTPLIHSATLSKRVGAPVYLKCENLQKTGSYKPRGGLNRIAKLGAEEKLRGVIVMSAGNLAQGVAYAARQAGVRCWVVMLETAFAAKVQAVRGYGAEVVLHPDPRTWFDRVEQLRARHGAVVIDPWADEALIAGYGSIGSEILEDLPDVETVVVPVGGAR
jgi:threonine dehydratase